MNIKTTLEEPKGIEVYRTNTPSKISLEELLNKLEIMYDEKNDTINIKCNSNILIQAENTILVSKNDTVLLSGNALGINKGKIFLNPLIYKFKKFFKI